MSVNFLLPTPVERHLGMAPRPGQPRACCPHHRGRLVLLAGLRPDKPRRFASSVELCGPEYGAYCRSGKGVQQLVSTAKFAARTLPLLAVSPAS